MNTLRDDFLKELECAVCTDYMVPPIMMCETGHSICFNCKPKLVSCPFCKKPFLNLRNKALEKLSLMAKYPCCYKSYGCQLVFKAEMKFDHETVCPYRPYTCPLLQDFRIKCQWSGNYADLKEHITTKHTDRLTYIKSWRHVYIRRYKEEHRYSRVIFACDEIFYQQFEVIDNTFYFVIQHVGPKNYGSNFQYTFSLGTSEKVDFVSMGFVARSYQVDIENVYRSGQCVKLCYDTVKNFLDDNNDLNFDFVIKTIE